MSRRPIRVVLAKIGLDGHDRGVKVVARALRDAGMEVIYTGLWRTPDHVVRAVADEDADVLGVSILSGAHFTLLPIVIEQMRSNDLGHVPVVVGGIIPEEDMPEMDRMGVARTFGPGATLDAIVEFIRERVGMEPTAIGDAAPS